MTEENLEPEAELLKQTIDNSLLRNPNETLSFNELHNMYHDKAIFKKGKFIGNIVIEKGKTNQKGETSEPLIRILYSGINYNQFKNMIETTGYELNDC